MPNNLNKRKRPIVQVVYLQGKEEDSSRVKARQSLIKKVAKQNKTTESGAVRLMIDNYKI